MAKRARGSVRPGQRRPVARRPAPASPAGPTAPAAPRPSGLTETEAQRAAELEAQLLEQERAAEVARTRTKERATRDVVYGGGASLAVKAEEEYAYVARDVKRIVRTGTLMLAILFVLWYLIDIAKVFPIG
jgi:hypothetical protein